MLPRGGRSSEREGRGFRERDKKTKKLERVRFHVRPETLQIERMRKGEGDG